MIKRLVKVNLPSEYQLLDYIEGVDSAILSNTIPNGNFKMVVDAQPTSSYFGFGINEVYRFHISQFADYFHFGYGGGDGDWINTIPFDYERHILSLDSKGKCTVDNQEFQINPSLGTDLTVFTSPISVMGQTNNASPLCNCKLYSMKIYKDEVLYNDFVPCKIKSDNVVGVYDLVQGAFFSKTYGNEPLGGNNVNDIKEIKAIKRYIPNVGLVNIRKVLKDGDKQVFHNDNLFELRKFVSFDAYIGDSINLLEALVWNEGFITNDSGYEGFRSGEPRQGNFSHMYSEPIALQKGDMLNYSCSVGPVATEGALYSNSDANADSFVRYAQRGEVITEDGLYFRGCYDTREDKKFAILKKAENGILAVSKGEFGDNFITDARSDISHNKSVLKHGHTYKISFDAKCESSPNRTLWLHYADDIDSTDTSQNWQWTISGTGEWEHIEFEYTPSIKDMGIRLYAPFSSEATTQYYKNIVIEKII